MSDGAKNNETYKAIKLTPIFSSRENMKIIGYLEKGDKIKPTYMYQNIYSIITDNNIIGYVTAKDFVEIDTINFVKRRLKEINESDPNHQYCTKCGSITAPHSSHTTEFYQAGVTKYRYQCDECAHTWKAYANKGENVRYEKYSPKKHNFIKHCYINILRKLANL